MQQANIAIFLYVIYSKFNCFLFSFHNVYTKEHLYKVHTGKFVYNSRTFQGLQLFSYCFQGLKNTDLHVKILLRECKIAFKYFSSLCEPCYSRNLRSVFCTTAYFVRLFVLMLYIPVNNFSVTSG